MVAANGVFQKTFLELIKKKPYYIIQCGSRVIGGITDVSETLKAYVRDTYDPTDVVASSEKPWLAVPSVRSFYTLDPTESPPVTWMEGISTYYPHRNAMGGLYGSMADREFIRKNRNAKVLRAVGMKNVIKLYDEKACWYIDAEGADYEIIVSLLTCSKSSLFLFERALCTLDEILTLRALASSLGFKYTEDNEDMCIYRELAA
jgi:hypothetical protein